MHILKLFPHWEKKDYLFDIVGEEEQIAGEKYKKLQLYRIVKKNHLERQPGKYSERLGFLATILEKSQQIEFKNPIIEYV